MFLPLQRELTKEKLDAFKVSYSFDDCYTFLSNKNKKSLLFFCLKPKSNLGGDKTHVVYYYFCNGGSWEEAKSLGRRTDVKDVLLVRTSTWLGQRDREINNSDEAVAKFDKFGTKQMKCEFNNFSVKGSEKKDRKFVCFDKTEYKLEWKLQDLVTVN